MAWRELCDMNNSGPPLTVVPIFSDDGRPVPEFLAVLWHNRLRLRCVIDVRSLDFAAKTINHYWIAVLCPDWLNQLGTFYVMGGHTAESRNALAKGPTMRQHETLMTFLQKHVDIPVISTTAPFDTSKVVNQFYRETVDLTDMLSWLRIIWNTIEDHIPACSTKE